MLWPVMTKRIEAVTVQHSYFALRFAAPDIPEGHNGTIYLTVARKDTRNDGSISLIAFNITRGMAQHKVKSSLITYWLNMSPYLVLFHIPTWKNRVPCCAQTEEKEWFIDIQTPLECGGEKRKAKLIPSFKKNRHKLGGPLCANLMRMAPLSNRRGPWGVHLLVMLAASKRKYYSRRTSGQTFQH